MNRLCWLIMLVVLTGCATTGPRQHALYTGRVINCLPEKIVIEIYGVWVNTVLTVDAPRPGQVGRSVALSLPSGPYTFEVFLADGRHYATHCRMINRFRGDNLIAHEVLGTDKDYALDWFFRVYPRQDYRPSNDCD